MHLKVVSVLLFLFIYISAISGASTGWKEYIVNEPLKLVMKGLGLSEQTDNELNPIKIYILKLIRELQSHMKEGMPSLGIPPLDPLRIPEYHFDLDEFEYEAKGELRDVTVSKLSTFNVTDIDSNIFKKSVSVSLEIPYFEIRGRYDLEGKFLKIFPIYGEGPFMLKPTDVKCKVFLVVSISSGKLIIQSLDYELDIMELYAKFDGIMGGGVIGSIFSSILNKMGLQLFYTIEPMVHGNIRTILIDDINKMLEGASMGDITSLMSPIIDLTNIN